MADNCFVSKHLRRGVDGKHLMRFQNKKTVFKFLLRGRKSKIITDSLTAFEEQT